MSGREVVAVFLDSDWSMYIKTAVPLWVLWLARPQATGSGLRDP
jgi:hypothetical protein